MAYIQYINGIASNIYRLPDHEMAIFGRGDHCEFQLFHKKVSREHFAIQRDEDGSFVLIDLGSKNSTHHNDKKLINETVVLKNNDRIQAADFTFIFYASKPDCSTAEIMAQVANKLQTEEVGFRTAMHAVVDAYDNQ
jgi:pSer/pThr/pTyr-binding forkhead associated (FHA) protein